MVVFYNSITTPTQNWWDNFLPSPIQKKTSASISVNPKKTSVSIFAKPKKKTRILFQPIQNKTQFLFPPIQKNLSFYFRQPKKILRFYFCQSKKTSVSISVNPKKTQILFSSIQKKLSFYFCQSKNELQHVAACICGLRWRLWLAMACDGICGLIIAHRKALFFEIQSCYYLACFGDGGCD